MVCAVCVYGVKGSWDCPCTSDLHSHSEMWK